MNNKTAVVIIQTDQLDWLKKNPSHFINAIFSRIEMDETDKYPGFARWHGDGVPGVQVVWISNVEKNQTCILSAGNGFGSKIAVLKTKNNNNKENKIDLLRLLANKFGYELKKKENDD